MEPSANSRRAFLIPASVVVALLGFAAWSWPTQAPGLTLAFGLAAATIAIWSAWLWRRATRTGQWPQTSTWIRRPHVVQLLVQAGVYGYWGWYWGEVYAQVPLIIAQVIFAYGVDVCLSWTRFGNWRAGFGPWPVIGSINLFMWFHDEWFALQFAMVAGAYLSRVYITWKKRPGHIFNPSGIVLAAASVILIALNQTEITRAAEIAVQLSSGPLIHLAIFALGLTVQAFVPVVLITMSAAVTVLAFSYVTIAQTGAPYFDVIGIPPAVFLGMNLLITDPASSPRRDLAKVLYGVSYGLAVVGLYPLLKALGAHLGEPSDPVPLAHFDKLLAVPLLNVLWPLYDRLAERLAPGTAKRPRARNLVHQALWAVIFGLTWPTIVFSAGNQVTTWARSCATGRQTSCRVFREMLESQCDAGKGAMCQELGIIRAAGGLLPQDEREAERRFAQGCTAGHAEACSYQGVQLLHRPPVTPAMEAQARALFEKSCTGGSPEGCEKLALSLMTGVGGPKDPARAARLMSEACAAGVESACGR